jgi:YVTN family beta-propeller protein
VRIRIIVPAIIVAAWVSPTFARTGLLPSNQRVSGRGSQFELIQFGLFPSGMVMSQDGGFLFVTNNGFTNQSLMTFNTATRAIHEVKIGLGFNQLFQGIALAPDGRTGFASGGPTDVVRPVTIADDGSLTEEDEIPLSGFPAGMVISPDGQRLYVTQNLAHAVAVIDVANRTVLTSIPVGKSPWGLAIHPTRHELYVTNRGDRTATIIDTDMNVVRSSVSTGVNPNAIAVTPDGSKVFIANANSDDVTVFDVLSPATARTISLTPFEGARPGSSPSALAISPDGRSVYVATSWENAVAVIDAASETVRGYLPTGFYPSAIAVSRDSQLIYIANMKGDRTYPRTTKIQKLDLLFNVTLGGTYGVHGTLQIVHRPSEMRLRGFTHRVAVNNGWDTGVRPSNHQPTVTACSPIPCTGADESPMQHVFFVVRENKTYDQILGDLPEGDGDPSLQIYKPKTTPNVRALVREFALFDRLFVNAEKSEPAHAWSAGAIDTDYEERTWVPVSFNVRPDDIGAHHSSNDTGEEVRGLMGPIATPEGGFWFDNCFNHGLSFRNYGEFLRIDDAGNPIDYWLQNTSLDFRVFDLAVSDVSRFETWRNEFTQQIAGGTVPRFTYIALPNDHTGGSSSGLAKPDAYVADNDFALGKIVETISAATDIWKQSVIFVMEDDSQSGGDHVDSHRTVGTVIGPYVRRHQANHTRYDMVSMHRTMELILGLPPMSRFDQMAIVMRDVFTDTPDFTPFIARPQEVPLNLPTSAAAIDNRSRAAQLSRQYDFSRPDRVPDAVLNEILWDYFHEPEQQQ